MQNSDIHQYNDQVREWNVSEDQAGLRLDRYLITRLEKLSRTSIQQMITEGPVLVNGRKSKAGYSLRNGDHVHVIQLVARPYTGKATPQPLPLDIVYEDQDLLVINKAAGMVVHPAPGHSDDTLVNALLARYPDLHSIEGLRPGIVHRLDRDTSGLMLVAMNAQTQAALIEQLKRHEIVKRYLALVEGIVSLDTGSIDAPIGRDPRNRQQMAITAIGSREARTHFRVLQRFKQHTLLLLQLETGRTHQIRVHLQAIGHPVVGDPVYGSSRDKQKNMGISRQFLHAYQLTFIHPRTGEALTFEASLPADLESVLQQESSL